MFIQKLNILKFQNMKSIGIAQILCILCNIGNKIFWQIVEQYFYFETIELSDKTSGILIS